MSENKNLGAVVVTGASSGIGRATAVRLAWYGYRVYAGYRRAEDGAKLDAAALGIIPVHLDVTDPESVAALRERLSDELNQIPLRALINNAGTTVAAPIEYVPLEDLRRVLEVNVVGQVALIQALLPLLRRNGGRVINISSMGGRIAGPIMGPYAASKFALEAITDALRREVEAQGLTVVVIEPGAVATPIWHKIDSKLRDDGLSPSEQRMYGDLIAGVQEGIFKTSVSHGVPPETIAEVVKLALTRTRPRARYLIGRSARARVVAAKVLPVRLFDRLLTGMLRRIGRRVNSANGTGRDAS